MRRSIERLAWLIDQDHRTTDDITMGELAARYEETTERIMDAIDVIKIVRGESTQIPPVAWFR